MRKGSPGGFGLPFGAVKELEFMLQVAYSISNVTVYDTQHGTGWLFCIAGVHLPLRAEETAASSKPTFSVETCSTTAFIT
jgi:hypothetical protein